MASLQDSENTVIWTLENLYRPGEQSPFHHSRGTFKMPHKLLSYILMNIWKAPCNGG